MVTDADRKRTYVSDLYPGAHWKRKVSRMPDEQITAIYLKHQGDGEKPDEHDETDQPDNSNLVFEGKPPTVDIPTSINSRGPHHNEDDFHLY